MKLCVGSGVSGSVVGGMFGLGYHMSCGKEDRGDWGCGELHVGCLGSGDSGGVYCSVQRIARQ